MAGATLLAFNRNIRHKQTHVMTPHDLREYQEIFNLPTLLICVIGPDGTFRKTNIAQKHILGWNPEELVGQPVAEFVLAEDAARTALEIGRVLTNPGSVVTDFRNRCIHKDGGYRWISWSGSAKDGFIYCIGTDVTDKHESEARYRRLFESNMIGIITGTHDGAILDANERFLSTVGYSRDDLNAGLLDWTKITPPEYLASDQKAVEQVARFGTCDIIEKEYIRKDGSRVAVLVGGTALPGTSNGGIAFVLDISELKKTRRELEQAVKVRDEFLSIASHELKTPLTSMRLQVQMRARKLAQQEPQSFTADKLKQMFEFDLRQIERVSRLVDDMLDISRISAGKLTLQKEKFDLCELVHEVAQRLSPQFEKLGIALTISGKGPVSGCWDKFRLEQVIVNLLTNAEKYGAGKPITVTVGRRGDVAFLAVEDQGIGIATNDQARIFERFERAVSSKTTSGLGLGLFIVKEIVNAHRGSVRLKSELGSGATFAIELPIDCD